MTVKPKLSAFNAMIQMHAEEGNMEDAQKVFDDLIRESRPDAFSFSFLVLGYYKVRQREESFLMFQS